MREYGSQAVVWQTAINPVVALELLDEGTWKGAGVLGPEAFPPQAVPRTPRRARLTARPDGAPGGRSQRRAADHAGGPPIMPAGRRSPSPAVRSRRRARRRLGLLVAPLRRHQVDTVGDVFGADHVQGGALDRPCRGCPASLFCARSTRGSTDARRASGARRPPPMPIQSGRVMQVRFGLDVSGARSRRAALIPIPNSIRPPITGRGPSEQEVARAFDQVVAGSTSAQATPVKP